MAISKNGINGSFSGKAGSIIGYKLNGQDIIRGLPRSRTKEPTEKEQANRDKFAQLQAWLKPLLGYLRIGFKNYAPTFQGFVAAKSYNSKHAFRQNEDGSFFIDPSLALVSFGSIPLPQTMSMEKKGNDIIITWSTEESHLDYNHAMVLAYAPTTRSVTGDSSIAKRRTGSAVLPIWKAPKEHELHVYLAFLANDYNGQSNSHYLGSVTM